MKTFAYRVFRDFTKSSFGAGFVVFGTVLSLLGWLIGFAGLQTGSSLGFLGGLALKLVMALVAVLFIWVGSRLRAFGKQVRALEADRVRRRDVRAPVVLLRSFRDDALATAHGKSLGWILDGQALTLEEALSKQFSRIGPVVAIGKPSEKLPPVGFSRTYVDTNDWEGEVDSLIAESRLVVMVLGVINRDEEGNPDGLGIEVKKLIKMNVPEKVLLVVPPLSLSELRERWASFERCFEPGSQPGYRIKGDELYVAFDKDWNPEPIRDSFPDVPDKGLAYERASLKVLDRFRAVDLWHTRGRRIRRALAGGLLGTILGMFLFGLLGALVSACAGFISHRISSVIRDCSKATGANS